MKTIKDRLLDPEKCFKFKTCKASYQPKCDAFGNLDMGDITLRCFGYVSRLEEYERIIEIRDVGERGE